MRGGEVLAELIDIDRLVVAVDIRILEIALRDEVLDLALIAELHHGTIHPALVLVDQSEVWIVILHDTPNHCGLVDEIRLEEQSILRHEIVLCQVE